jgi:hypothetical protein
MAVIAEDERSRRCSCIAIGVQVLLMMQASSAHDASKQLPFGCSSLHSLLPELEQVPG